MKETNGSIPAGASSSNKTKVKPLRYSECGLVGATEKLSSNVIVPDSRIKAPSETGAESNSGDITTEWNVDEQDELLGAVMCSSWVSGTPTAEETSAGVTEKKSLAMGSSRSTFSVIKKYTQSPVEYQHFKNEQVNQLAISFPLKSYVTMGWSFMGSNHPKTSTTDPISDVSNCAYDSALSTKAFKTLEGYFKIGNDFNNLETCRQCSNFTLTINNNMESTSALFEKEAIEQSLGDFEVTGSFDIYKAGDFARQLENDAIDGKEKAIKIFVSRKEGTTETSYTINLTVNLDGCTESKDGNKLKNTISFSVGKSNGITFGKQIKTVSA